VNKSVFVGVITILLIVSIYSSSFTFDVSNAVPEYSEIECISSESTSTICCQETWDGEIIGSWLKTCTACDAEATCYTYNSNTLGPASTPPKSTAPKDIGDGDNIGILDESPTPTPNPKNNDAAGNVGILDKSATISTPNPKDNDVNNQNDDKGLEQQETSSNSNDGNVSLD